MLAQNYNKHIPGLVISKYAPSDLSLLLPLLAEEFPNWNFDKLKSYINLVLKKKSNGILVVKNNALYNLGLLIYSIQDISAKNLCKNKKEEFTKCLIVENLIVSSPVLEKKIFLLLTEKAIDIAENNSCDFAELPRFNQSFDLIKDKYKENIFNLNGWRTFIKIEKILTANKEL